MATTELTSTNLYECANYHRNIARVLMDRLGVLQAERQSLIGSSSSLVNSKEQEIIDTNSEISWSTQKAQDLDSQAIIGIIADTDLQEAMTKISEANKQVLKAIEKIDDIRRVFQYIDLFIRVAGGIVGAAITTTPPAQIKASIKAINILYDSDVASGKI